MDQCRVRIHYVGFVGFGAIRPNTLVPLEHVVGIDVGLPYIVVADLGVFVLSVVGLVVFEVVIVGLVVFAVVVVGVVEDLVFVIVAAIVPGVQGLEPALEARLPGFAGELYHLYFVFDLQK